MITNDNNECLPFHLLGIVWRSQWGLA